MSFRLCALSVLLINLNACSKTFMRNPESGEVAQCFATGMYPMQNELECMKLYEDKGWVRVDSNTIQKESLEMSEREADTRACYQGLVQNPNFTALIHNLALGSVKDQSPSYYLVSSTPSLADQGVLKIYRSLKKECMEQSSAMLIKTGASQSEIEIDHGSVVAEDHLVKALSEGQLSYGSYAKFRNDLNDLKDSAFAMIQSELTSKRDNVSQRCLAIVREFEKKRDQILDEAGVAH